MQPGDVNITYSDFSHAKEILNYEPKIKIECNQAMLTLPIVILVMQKKY